MKVFGVTLYLLCLGASSLLSIENRESSCEELKEAYSLALELKECKLAHEIVDKGIKSEESLYFLIEKYRLFSEEGKASSREMATLRETILAQDPSNKKGVALSLALIDFQTRELASAADRKEVIRPLEEYLSRFGEKDIENRWRIELLLAQFYLHYDQAKEALNHAETALKCAPDEKKEEMQQMIERVRKREQSLR